MSSPKLDFKNIPEQLNQYVQKLRHYSLITFIAFVAILYALVLFRINTLSNQQPSESAVTKQVNAVQAPHIDQAVVRQLESLQDNSVSVQALFNEARSNPFEE